MQILRLRAFTGFAGPSPFARSISVQWISNPPPFCTIFAANFRGGDLRPAPHIQPQPAFPSCLPLFADSDSVMVISKTTGWASGISERWLLGNLPRNANSIRCIAVSTRRNELPRTETSCVAKTNRRCCCFPSILSSAKANWSNGSNRLRSADSSILTP